MQGLHYLDNAATTKPCEAAVEAVMSAMSRDFGNPSSLYRLGIDAEQIIDGAKKAVAKYLGVERDCIYFTSCATESSNTVIFGAAENYGKRKKKIVTTAIEHPSVEKPIEKLEKAGFQVVRVAPGSSGEITAESIVSAVDGDTFLVSCMLVNNETGYILPVAQAFREIKRKSPDCITHCDGVQGFLKTDMKPLRTVADCISLSGHKVCAPKGVGAVYVKKGVRIAPLLLGGGQEKGFRSGTESVPLIAGFGSAVCELGEKIQENYARAEALRAYLWDGLKAIGGIVINSGADHLPYINSITVPGIKSETLLHYLEARGVYVSSGSACSRGKKSSVLKALGFSDAAADSTVRVSFSHETTEADIDAFAEGVMSAKKELAKVR